MSPVDPIWDELGKIDYFLDHIARAVERGYVDAGVYATLSPRYLERRAELAAIIDARAARARGSVPAPPPVAAEIAGESAARPSAPAWSATASAASAAPPAYAAPERTYTPSPGYQAPAPSPLSSVSPGTWMAYAGGFLVVIAVAIFTIWAWPSLPALARLAILAAVTAAFYISGGFVRTKMELPAVGISLIAVGSAMLLFDGWAVINGFGLQGPLPWAVLLLICSLVYWATEVRLTGGWFGGIGAAAQIGWWWLLGDALGWDTHWVIAGIAVIAVLWSLASGRAREDSPLAALDAVLRVGSLLVAVAATLAMTVAVILVSVADAASIEGVYAAAVCALACTVIVWRSAPEAHPASVLSHIPLFVAVLASWIARIAVARGSGPTPIGHPGTDLILVMLALALGYHVWAIVRGGGAFAALAMLADLALVLGIADQADWRAEVVVGAVVALGVLTIAVGRLLDRMLAGEDRSGTAAQSSAVWENGGSALLVLSTLAVVVVSVIEAPLTFAFGWREAALAGWVLAAWIGASVLRRTAFEGWAVWATSLYAGWVIAAWAAPLSEPAALAIAPVVLLVVWTQSRGAAQHWLRIPAAPLLWVCRVSYLIVLPSLLSQAVRGDLMSWETVALLATIAVAWALDGVRYQDHWAFGVAAPFAVAASATAAWTAWDRPAAAVAGALCGAVLAGIGALRPLDERGWGSWTALGASVATSVCALTAIGHSDRFAIALALAALTWGLAAYDSGVPELGGVAAVFGTSSILALLHWTHPAPWVTVASLAAFAALLLVPSVLLRQRGPGRPLRLVRATAVAGALTFLVLCSMGWVSHVIGTNGWPAWYQIGTVGLATSLVLAGAYALVWTTTEQSEIGLYPGIGLIVIGVLVTFDHAGIEQAEIYLLSLAAYVGGMGVLWASRAPERRVPGGTDVGAFALAVAMPALLSLNLFDAEAALEHGLWTLALACVSVILGRATSTRIYFVGGITVLMLESLWLSRNVLVALPSWVWIGATGLALIFGGVTFARREALGDAARRLQDGFEGWR